MALSCGSVRHSGAGSHDARSPDYRHLIDQRVAALACHRITVSEVCSTVARLAPFDGAAAFIQTLREKGRVVIVSDSLRPMNRHFLEALPVDAVLCHDFEVVNDMIAGFRFWNALAGKHPCFDTIDLNGSDTFAMGDALNDLTMIRAASRGALFRPSCVTRKAAPDLRVVTTYEDAVSASSG